jgi:hypothetical protein
MQHALFHTTYRGGPGSVFVASESVDLNIWDISVMGIAPDASVLAEV